MKKTLRRIFSVILVLLIWFSIYAYLVYTDTKITRFDKLIEKLQERDDSLESQIKHRNLKKIDNSRCPEGYYYSPVMNNRPTFNCSDDGLTYIGNDILSGDQCIMCREPSPEFCDCMDTPHVVKIPDNVDMEQLIKNFDSDRSYTYYTAAVKVRWGTKMKKIKKLSKRFNMELTHDAWDIYYFRMKKGTTDKEASNYGPNVSD